MRPHCQQEGHGVKEERAPLADTAVSDLTPGGQGFEEGVGGWGVLF